MDRLFRGTGDVFLKCSALRFKYVNVDSHQDLCLLNEKHMFRSPWNLVRMFEL